MNLAAMMNDATSAQRTYLLGVLQRNGPKWTTVSIFLGAWDFDVQAINSVAVNAGTTPEAEFLSRVFSANPSVPQSEFCRALDYAELRAVSANVHTWPEFSGCSAAESALRIVSLNVGTWPEFGQRSAASPSPMITDAPRGQAISADARKAQPLSSFVRRFPDEPRDAQRAQQLVVIKWEQHYATPQARGEFFTYAGMMRMNVPEEWAFAEYSRGPAGGWEFLEKIGGMELGAYLKMLHDTSHAALADAGDDVISGRLGDDATERVNTLIAASTVVALLTDKITSTNTKLRKGEMAKVLVDNGYEDEVAIRELASSKQDLDEFEELTRLQRSALRKAFGGDASSS